MSNFSPKNQLLAPMFPLFLKFRLFLAASLALALTTGWLHAAPYGLGGMEIEWTQPGGEKLSLRVVGDEFYGRTETFYGYTTVFDKITKSYEYAKPGTSTCRL